MLNNSTAKSRYWKQIKGKKFEPQPIIAPLHYVKKIKGGNQLFFSVLYISSNLFS